MNCVQYIYTLSKNNMTSFYNGVPHSSGVSEISTAPPSPVSGSNTVAGTSPSNASRYGVMVPNRVFVGGIASNTTETELQELFSQFGNIKEIKIISDRGGVCKGYGFVTFETEEEAKKVHNQPESIVLKERRLNIAPAVMKQQPFGRPFDVAPPTGALLYHNGTSYTYQNGMAFFAAQSAQSPYPAREPSMYTAPFGPSQTAPTAPYPQIMYAPYTQPMPYLAAGGQQYQYPMPYDFFKAVGPASPYIYAPPSVLNGALNNALNGGIGNTSQSPSPGYGQSPAVSGPTGAEMYYNGVSHHTPMTMSQHQPMYPVESSPVHSEDWNPELRQAHTPVVSLLKLREEGSVEELEITRTPRKSYPPQGHSAGGPRPRSRRPGRPAPSPSQGRSQGRGAGSLAGQRSASSPHLPSAPNPCLHRSTSLSPSNQVTPAYSSRQLPQHQNQQPHHQGYHPRRGVAGSTMRTGGSKLHLGRGNSYHSNSGGSHGPHSNQIPGGVSNIGQNSVPKAAPKNTSSPKSATPPSGGNPSVAAQKQEKSTVEESVAGDAAAVRHALPLSPPNTPLPSDSSADPSITAGGGNDDVCQKMKALAL